MINKKLLLLCVGISILSQIIYSQVPSYVPTNGLVGYWPFNGNANDQSVNGNNGAVNGATLTTDRFGNSNSAYSFNGISDYITIPNSTSLSNMTGITISAWFNINQWDVINNQGWFPIISKTNSSSYGKYRLGANTSIAGEPSFYSNLDTSESDITQSNLYSLNQWNQIVITISNGNSTISLNGVQVFNGVTTVPGWNTIDNLPLLIGKDIPGLVDYANGKIDDIGIWNRPLTQQEITSMYNGVTYSDTCNAVSGSLVNGLVAYYPFCGNANDQSGNGLNGVVNGAILTLDRFGNSNSAYHFDGLDDVISANVNLPQNVTVSCWIKSEFTTNEFPTFFDFQLSTTNFHWIFYGQAAYNTQIGSRYVTLDNTSSPLFCDNVNLNGLSLNNWQFVTVVVDSATNKHKLYVNGILTNENTIQGTPQIADLIEFGRTGQSANHETNFYGSIDDIGIWNRALTPQEITQLYNQNQCVTNITVTDTLIINVGQLSYTNPVTYANNITIYPNPANTQVNISFNNITDLTGGNINIVNSLGQQVATTPITLSGTNTTMQLNSWGGTGLYFVQILNAQGIVVDVKKIILQ